MLTCVLEFFFSFVFYMRDNYYGHDKREIFRVFVRVRDNDALIVECVRNFFNRDFSRWGDFCGSEFQ